MADEDWSECTRLMRSVGGGKYVSFRSEEAYGGMKGKQKEEERRRKVGQDIGSREQEAC